MTYLAALGLARVVAEQADPRLRLRWEGGSLVLETQVEDLADFLVRRYVPTPVVSPWNGGSGYGEKDKNQRANLDALVQSGSPRLAAFGETDSVARQVAAKSRRDGWDKARAVLEMRNRCPDAALPWIDAAVVLAGGGEQERAFFPPLLGTGGNDGRLDFSSNFHQRLADVLPDVGAGESRSTEWAHDLLTGGSDSKLLAKTVGQFDAFAAGGPGTTGADDPVGLVNPWAFVLMIEGAVMFAASAVSRLGERARRASIPFTVQPSPEGLPEGATEEEIRGELWAPVVDHWMSWAQWHHMFAAASRGWDGATASTASQMYGAVHSNGVDRRVSSWCRFGLSKRNGLAFVAVLLDEVESGPMPDIQVMTIIGRCIEQYDTVPHGLGAQRLRLARAAHLAACRDTSSTNVLAALRALTLLEVAARRTDNGKRAFRNAGVRPSGQALASLLADAPAAWRVGAALASARVPVDADGAYRADRSAPEAPLRRYLVGERHRGVWLEPVVDGVDRGDLVRLLGDFAVWRSRHIGLNRGGVGQGFRLTRGHRYRCPWQEMHAWARGESWIPDRDVADAFLGMLALDFEQIPLDRPRPVGGWPDPALAVMQAFAGGHLVDPQGDPGSPESRRGLMPAWPSLLASGEPAAMRAIGEATQRANRLVLRARAAAPTRQLQFVEPIRADGPRILAALVGPTPARPIQTWASAAVSGLDDITAPSTTPSEGEA